MKAPRTFREFREVNNNPSQFIRGIRWPYTRLNLKILVKTTLTFLLVGPVFFPACFLVALGKLISEMDPFAILDWADRHSGRSVDMQRRQDFVEWYINRRNARERRLYKIILNETETSD